MNVLINSQIGTFFIYFLAGVVICLLYDIFRAMRKTIKTSDFITYIEDTIFWLIVAIFLVYLIFVLDSGQIRFFMFLAICFGGIIYYFTLSKYFMNVSVKFLGLIKKILKKILTIFLIPIKIFLKINKKVKCIVCINLRNLKKNMSKKPKKIKEKKKLDRGYTKKIKINNIWSKIKKKSWK